MPSASSAKTIPEKQDRATGQPLRVLIVEDSEPDARLLVYALRNGGYEPAYERVQTHEEMKAALERQPWDIVIADHAMPRFSAPAALALLKEMGLDLPFIIVSGHIGEEVAVAAMKAGAHDYLMKDKLARLVPAVERELREAEVRHARRQAEEELHRSHAQLELRVQQRTAELTGANEKLQQLIAERKQLEQELLEITERERRRIGLDLHDDLGQKLTGLSLMIKGLAMKLSRKRLPEAEEARKIQGLIEQAINHASGLAHDLAALDRRSEDLKGALKDLATQARSLFNISCRFRARGKIPPLEAGVVRQFYKIAQEAVTNAIKHGKAREVNISLASNGASQLVLTVSNNGLPFPDIAAERSGMGLRIMSYRASVIGASLDVRSEADRGAVVVCTLPLN